MCGYRNNLLNLKTITKKTPKSKYIGFIILLTHYMPCGAWFIQSHTLMGAQVKKKEKGKKQLL